MTPWHIQNMQLPKSSVKKKPSPKFTAIQNKVYPATKMSEQIANLTNEMS